MPKITEGQYALGALTVFAIWVFFILPFKDAIPQHGEFWNAKLTDWLLAVFTLALVLFTRELVQSTNRLWDAGERQREAMMAANVAAQRAWLTASVGIKGDLHRSANGSISVPIFIKITNLGKTPALHAQTTIETIGDSGDALRAVRVICAENRLNEDHALGGRLVLPGESYERPFIACLGEDEVKYFWGWRNCSAGRHRVCNLSGHTG
jgi:hypothetical protein